MHVLAGRTVGRRSLTALAAVAVVIPMSGTAHAGVPPAVSGGATQTCVPYVLPCIAVSGSAVVGTAGGGAFWCAASGAVTQIRVSCVLGSGSSAGSFVNAPAAVAAGVDHTTNVTASDADLCITAYATTPTGPYTFGPVCFPGYQL